ncbi:MAG: hypothetical protein ACW97V_09290 [Promethearchaeota archaeon]
MDNEKTSKIEGKLVAETEKALLVKFKSGKETWIPKSTLKSQYLADKAVSQMFIFDTWILEKKGLIIDKRALLQPIIQELKSRHSENLLAIYGIGSFFDENLPTLWIKTDIDLILIVKSIEDIPKEDWEKRFYPRSIEGYEVFLGYNTLDMYQNKKNFREFSVANYEWALIELAEPENSVLLHGQDIRDRLPNIDNLIFDFDDILARGVYHIEKSLREKDDANAMRELSKSIFKTGFYFCVYFSQNFRFTSFLEISKQLKSIDNARVRKMSIFFEESLIFRENNQFNRNFKKLRDDFTRFLIDSLLSGKLHRGVDSSELKIFLTKYFGGFPFIIRSLNKLI